MAQGTDQYAPPANYVSPDAYPPPQEMKDSPVSDTVSIGEALKQFLCKMSTANHLSYVTLCEEKNYNLDRVQII